MVQKNILTTIVNFFFLYNHQSFNSKIINEIKKTKLKDRILFNNDEIKNENFYLNLSDILITIKTSSKNHNNRLKNIIDTWYQQARSQVI